MVFGREGIRWSLIRVVEDKAVTCTRPGHHLEDPLHSWCMIAEIRTQPSVQFRSILSVRKKRIFFWLETKKVDHAVTLNSGLNLFIECNRTLGMTFKAL